MWAGLGVEAGHLCQGMQPQGLCWGWGVGWELGQVTSGPVFQFPWCSLHSGELWSLHRLTGA